MIKDNSMLNVKTIRTIVYPTRDLMASVTAWSKILGDPVYQNDNSVTFLGKDGIDIRLSRLPWVNYPLTFWEVEDIEKAHANMLRDGAIAMSEVQGGTLAEIGKQPITNGDSKTGVISVPGRKLAIFRLADGNLVGLVQDLPTAQ
ncbi:MAG TPA: VOC family protein [Patescibacteria group bacterium]|jgi:hypothetical protein|nr:VOC family protein [Patescibacteria group bacterium]